MSSPASISAVRSAPSCLVRHDCRTDMRMAPVPRIGSHSLSLHPCTAEGTYLDDRHQLEHHCPARVPKGSLSLSPRPRAAVTSRQPASCSPVGLGDSHPGRRRSGPGGVRAAGHGLAQLYRLCGRYRGQVRRRRDRAVLRRPSLERLRALGASRGAVSAEGDRWTFFIPLGSDRFPWPPSVTYISGPAVRLPPRSARGAGFSLRWISRGEPTGRFLTPPDELITVLTEITPVPSPRHPCEARSGS